MNFLLHLEFTGQLLSISQSLLKSLESPLSMNCVFTSLGVSERVENKVWDIIAVRTGFSVKIEYDVMACEQNVSITCY